VQDLAGLNDVLLLQDGERYYLALNRPIDQGKVANNGAIYNNFRNGTRCVPVNGWVLAYHKNAGQRKAGGRDIAWTKGDFHWHSFTPVVNQLLVLDQFEQMPILIFTSRYVEKANVGRVPWQWHAQSIQKSNGLLAFDSGPRGGLNYNGHPYFAALQIDLKSRTINLVGDSGSVQHFVDEGKGPPMPAGALNVAPPQGQETVQAAIEALREAQQRQQIQEILNRPRPGIRGPLFDGVQKLPALERPITK
jgi:hypothetical protein